MFPFATWILSRRKTDTIWSTHRVGPDLQILKSVNTLALLPYCRVLFPGIEFEQHVFKAAVRLEVGQCSVWAAMCQLHGHLNCICLFLSLDLGRPILVLVGQGDLGLFSVSSFRDWIDCGEAMVGHGRCTINKAR